MRWFSITLVACLAGCGASPTAENGGDGAGGSMGTQDAYIGKGGAQAGGVIAIAGSAGTGGGSGTAGTAGSMGVIVGDGGPTCVPSTALPAGAPTLTPGVWTNISPAGLVFDDKPTAFGQGITLDPCNYGTIYLSIVGFDPAVAKAGIYKSTDAGSSWTRVGHLDEPINIIVDPRNPQHLYASDGVRGSTMGFWVSNDAGATWTIPDGFTTTAKSVGACCDVYHVDADPADYDHLLVSFHSPWSNDNFAAGVLESVDGGNTWAAHQPVSGVAGGYGYGIFFLHNPALGLGDGKTWLYGCQSGKGHWRTTDAGQTWKQVTNNSMEHGGNQIYYTKSGVLYAGGFPKVMRSMDNGATWTTVGPDVNPAGYLSVFGDGKNLYTALHNGPATVITSPETDGLTWANYNSQTFAEGPFQMAFDPVNGILYASMIRAGAWALKLK